MSAEGLSTVEILGVRISAVNMDLALDRLAGLISSGEPNYVTVTGVHGVMESQRDPAIMKIHNEASMVTPDGMPLVWLGRSAGADWMDRVYGPDFVLAACRFGVEHGWRHYFYGGAPGVAERMAARLDELVPGLVVAGAASPPFRPLTDEEARQFGEELRATKSDIVWIGLSTPKQEVMMHRHYREWDIPVAVGVGAAFDFYAGDVRQAPRFIQRSGMEWAFRLAMEPRRLWKRYFRNNPEFLWRIMRARPQLRP